MPYTQQIEKARLWEIRWTDKKKDNKPDPVDPESYVPVQFNPETLKITLSNQAAGGDQAGGSGVQFVGRGTSKMTLDLLFDVTVPYGDKRVDPAGDVRNLTKRVAYFMTPKPEGTGDDQKWMVPGVRFHWGALIFDGVMESLNETLEYFSEDGRPLRATVSIGLSRPDIPIYSEDNKVPGAGSAGTQPLQEARQDETLQQLAARLGIGAGGRDWKSVAAANGIENPRRLPPGALLNMRVPRF